MRSLDCIGDLEVVDGHDIGSGERNIFVATDQPEPANRSIKSPFEFKHVTTDLKVAYPEGRRLGILPGYKISQSSEMNKASSQNCEVQLRAQMRNLIHIG